MLLFVYTYIYVAELDSLLICRFQFASSKSRCLLGVTEGRKVPRAAGGPSEGGLAAYEWCPQVPTGSVMRRDFSGSDRSV